MNVASHYVCTGGCQTVTYSPGKCRISGCPRFRNPLTECRCRNGKHGDLPHRNDPHYVAPPATKPKKKSPQPKIAA